MVDKINILFKSYTFNGSLRNCTFKRKTKNCKVFYIESLKEGNEAKIWVIQVLQKGRIYLAGSLRKWYHGENSLEDFNKKSFVNALQKIASILDMSLSDLALGTISNIEIGLNVRTRIACGDLLRKIVSYKSFHREDAYLERGSLYFGFDKKEGKNSIRKIILYDKTKEIADRINTKCELASTNRKRNAFKILQKHSYHFIRLEIKLRGRKAFKSIHLENVSNLYSIIEEWNNLYVAWTCHVAKILVSSQIDYSLPMTKKERLIAESLKHESAMSLIGKVESICTSKTINGLKAKKYRERKCIHDVILKFGTYADYNTYTFKADAALSLIRHCKKESPIAVGMLVRNLWKPTYTLLV